MFAMRGHRSTFMNYLLWYLGWMFLLTGITLLAGFAMFRAGYEVPALIAPIGLFNAGYNIEAAIREPFNVVNILIAAIVAVRCRVKLWLAVPAWVIGFLAIWLLSFLHGLNNELLVQFYEPFAVFVAIAKFQFYENVVIGAALLLNRWLVRRRRIKVEAAMPAVFD
jgi:hypothetical protein